MSQCHKEKWCFFKCGIAFGLKIDHAYTSTYKYAFTNAVLLPCTYLSR